MRPPWFTQHMALRDSASRHRWMCEQLVERRRLQFFAQSSLTKETPAGTAIRWYQDQLGVKGITHITEVLSDGLGYIEPNWHAAEVTDANHASIVVIADSALTEFQDSIRKKRQDLHNEANLPGQRREN